MSMALIVHAGAWEIPDDEVEAHRHACRRALAVGWEILRNGGSALETVQATVVVLEDDPALDAGIGSVLTNRGTVELDAGIMRGSDLKFGAVATVKRVQNPIVLARHIMESQFVFMTGEGAELFAQTRGMSLVEPETLIVPREQQRYEAWKRGTLTINQFGEWERQQRRHDTVGAVALDRSGQIVAGTSTGGTLAKPIGRVGDVPLVGCGFYADDGLGGASATGHGESIARTILAKTAVDHLRQGATAQEAARMAVRSLRNRVDGTGGVILLDHEGHIGFAHNTTRMACGYITEEMHEGLISIVAE